MDWGFVLLGSKVVLLMLYNSEGTHQPNCFFLWLKKRSEVGDFFSTRRGGSTHVMARFYSAGQPGVACAF